MLALPAAVLIVTVPALAMLPVPDTPALPAGLRVGPPLLPDCVIPALSTMPPCALRVSVVLALQLTASLTKMSPLPGPAAAVCRLMLVLASCADSAAPVMSPPLAAIT